MKTLCAVVSIIAICLVGSVLLQGCATVQPDPPRVETKDVKVAVAQPCKTDMGQRPALKTKAEILAAIQTAPNFDDALKIALDQTLLYMKWAGILEAGRTGCEGVPK